MRDVSDKNCTENQKTHFMFKNCFPGNRAFYETMWRNVLEPEATEGNIICDMSRA